MQAQLSHACRSYLGIGFDERTVVVRGRSAIARLRKNVA